MLKRSFYIVLLIHFVNLSYTQILQFVPASRGGSCCCGQFVELFYPNLDFEDAPAPPPGGLILYSVGQFFSGWTCTRATIDHKDAFFGNLTLGNPNGRSNFIDLHGSPGFGAIQYNLTGLTPGNLYRIDFWTAQNGSGYTSTGTLRIANGAWLNVNWTVSMDGSVSWFKVSHTFMAMATSANMEFSSIGGSEWGGTLIDDIKIFECPGDTEFPVVLNPQDDLEIECEKDLPKAATIRATDNCDPNPSISLKETFVQVDPCTKIITRTWEVKDACGNNTIEDQIITIQDKNPPNFTKRPQNKFVNCSEDVAKLFNDWIKANGEAIATDACGKVNWRTTIERIPSKACDTSLVEFIAIDHCGQENPAYATFYVIDTIAPKISKPAESKSFFCNPNARDSLRNWLSQHAYAEASGTCDTILWSNNFQGDSTKSQIDVWFYAKDFCGNVDSSFASFRSSTGSDTFRVIQYSCSVLSNTTDTLVYTQMSCDSIVITQTFKLNSDTVHLQLNTCDPTQSLSDTLYLNNVAGCDSLVIRNFTIYSVSKTILRDSSCLLDQLQIDTFLLSGQFCDSIVYFEHHPLRKDSVFIFNTSCDSTKKGTLIKNLQNKFLCDSIVTVVTDFSAETIFNITSTECGLTKAYIDTVRYSTSLCDSVVITHHIPLRVDSTMIQSNTCDPSKAGIFRNVLTNVLGCDSVVNILVHLLPSDTNLISKFTCDPKLAGSETMTLKNQFDCDSVIITETFLRRSDTLYFTFTTCDPSKAGRITTTYTNQQGCDSIVISDYQLKTIDTTFIFGRTCHFNQQKKDTTIFRPGNCDSVVIQSILFIPSDTTYQKRISCLPAEAGLDTLYLKNSKGCDSIIFSEIQYMPLELNYRVDSISCFNANDAKIELLNISDFTSPYQIFFDNKVITNTNSILNIPPGNHSVFVRDSKGCITNTYTIQILNPFAFLTDLGNDLLVNKGSKVELILQTNKPTTSIFWQPLILTSCTNCTKVDFIADQDTWVYTLSVDERNCSSLDSVFIRVRKAGFVYAPNAISANGDNINDYFYLIADDQAIIELLQIYDRWGEKVFETQQILPNKPELGWNGNFDSRKMNPGVYVYYARVLSGDGTIHTVKGDFTLIR